MKIGIIGAGWYGCHMALELKKAGHEVIIYDKNPDIFRGISGEFGIRLHKGPHYPRSEATRESCRQSFQEFCEAYPELVQSHEWSVYALGTTDAQGNPPKVDSDTFSTVCHESPECEEVNPDQKGFSNLQSAMSLEEPSIALGDKLRSFFKQKLANAGIPVVLDYEVKDIKRVDEHTLVTGKNDEIHSFDYVVNATSYQSFIPASFKTDFPVEMEVVYQPCLALEYKDSTPGGKPISFIVMDGWFPCLMPVITKDGDYSNYIMTHGSYTIMGSYDDPASAKAALSEVDDDFILSQIKPNTEYEMHRFWPAFRDRFEYQGWKGTVLAKIKTKTEFRSALTFEHEGIIYAFPGKVSNVLNASQEAIALVNNGNCLSQDGFRFMQHGVLAEALEEIAEKPAPGEPNTCNLHTMQDIKASTATLGIFKPASEVSGQQTPKPPTP